MNPFLRQTDRPFTAIKGQRKGYLQIASSNETLNYAQTSEELFLLARKWAIELEKLGAKRVYWITLSEQVKHLHIHLYPRWTDQEDKGLDLFQARNDKQSIIWDEISESSLKFWSEEDNVCVI